MAGILNGVTGGSLIQAGASFNRAVGAGNDYLGGGVDTRTPRGRDMEAILRLKEDYKQYHARRLRKHKDDQTFFELEYNVPTPEQNREPLKAPTAYSVVQQLQSHLSADNPVITALTRAKDQVNQRLASKQTAWLSGFWRKQQITLLMRKLIWYGAVRGCYCLRILYDPEAWPEKPLPPVEPAQPDALVTGSKATMEQYVADLADYMQAKEEYDEDLADWKNWTEEHLPILVQALDPQYVLWEPTEDPQSCIVVWDRTVDDIAATRPYDQDLQDYLSNFQPGQRVSWCEWWDDERYAYWIEPTGGAASTGAGAPYIVEEPRRHHYGFFPMVVDGPWVNPLQESEKQYPSIYFSTKSFLQYESTLITQMAHIFRKLGWPILIVKSENAHSDTNKPVLNLTPGAQNFLDTQEDAKYLELGSATMTLMERVISGVDEYIQDGTGLKDVLTGTPKGKSGYQQAQAAQAARVALVPVEQCLQRTLEKASLFALKLIRLVGERVTVMAAESTRDSQTALGPSEVQSIGIIKVQLKTVLPIDEAQKNKAIHDMVDWGYFDPIEGARLSGIENPEEKHEMAEVMRFEANPQIQIARAIKHVRENDPETWAIMQEFGLVKSMVDQMTSAAQGGPPGGPTGGSAPQGGKPKPPAAPGSKEESSQVQRQAMQGGQVPGKLQRAQPG